MHVAADAADGCAGVEEGARDYRGRGVYREDWLAGSGGWDRFRVVRCLIVGGAGLVPGLLIYVIKRC